MRRAAFVLFVLVAGAIASSCDTEQPSTGGGKSASIQLGTTALLILEDCYDRYTDLNGDGTPDFDRTVCAPAQSGEPGIPYLFENRLCPWRYSFRVLRVPAGQTFPEVVASSTLNGGTFPVFGSLNLFDTVVQSAPIRPDEPPYEFRNPRRISTGNPTYFATIGAPVGTPNVLGVVSATPGVSPRFDVDFVSGDTLIVEARKATAATSPPILAFAANDSNLILTGLLFVNGVEVTPSGGTTASSPLDGSGFSFSFTAP